MVEVSKKLKPLFMKYRERYGSEGGLFTSMVKIPLATLSEDPEPVHRGGALRTGPDSGKRSEEAEGKADRRLADREGRGEDGQDDKGNEFKKPFFLFIDLMEPHDPYTESKKTAMDWKTQYMKTPVKKSVIELWKRLYLKACRKGYAYSYEMIKDLTERYGDNQIIIFIADHGQAFNEHGFVGHGAMLYDEIVKIPMAVLLPKNFERVRRTATLR